MLRVSSEGSVLVEDIRNRRHVALDQLETVGSTLRSLLSDRAPDDEVTGEVPATPGPGEIKQQPVEGESP